MPRDYLSIGPAPYDEKCAQTGKTENWGQLQRLECAAFIKLIRRSLGEEPEGAELRTKGFPHDFGTYYEVVCYYECDSDSEVGSPSLEYALKCESDSPQNWDAEALAELKAAGHSLEGK